MKKGTKVTLLTAVVMVLTGGIMSTICLILGASWDVLEYPHRERTTDHLTHAEYAEAQEDMAADGRMTAVGEAVAEEYTIGEGYRCWDLGNETIENLTLDVGAATLMIESGDHYQVEVWNFDDRVKVDLNNNTLIVKCDGFDLLGWIGRGGGSGDGCPSILVTVPEPAVFTKLQCKVGAGSIEAGWLRAETARIDVDTGTFTCRWLEIAEKLEIDVDAGDAEIAGGSCEGKLKADVDAGSAGLNSFCAADVEFDVDAGSVVFEGSIEGDWYADCDVGSIDMYLTGSETYYNYMIDSNMGSVQVGSREISGLSDTDRIRNNAEYTGTIDCDLGSVTVAFSG